MASHGSGKGSTGDKSGEAGGSSKARDERSRGGETRGPKFVGVKFVNKPPEIKDVTATVRKSGAAIDLMNGEAVTSMQGVYRYAPYEDTYIADLDAVMVTAVPDSTLRVNVTVRGVPDGDPFHVEVEVVDAGNVLKGTLRSGALPSP